MEYLRATAYCRYPLEELLRKCLQDSLGIYHLRGCLVLIITEGRPQTLQRHSFTEDVFLKIL